MSTRLPAMLVIALSVGLAPNASQAESCGDYPLSAQQTSYLDTQSLDIAVPEGNVPVIQRCDIDGNNTVDILDIRAIARSRNQPAAHPDDPMDWDRNNVIDIYDARGCQRACTLPRCAVQENEPEQLVGGVTEEAACFQAQDFDGDGSQDFVGIYEHTGAETRGGDWGLEVVILTEDVDGNVQHITFPYTGKQSATTGELAQHLSFQPAGVVDLIPGSITIDAPGVVSYRNGEPKVIYYYVNDVLTQSFYGIVD